jgi:hypothetical protein
MEITLGIVFTESDSSHTRITGSILLQTYLYFFIFSHDGMGLAVA